MSLKAVAALMAAACLGACTTMRATQPTRSATEERLVSAAIDRAADRLADKMPTNLKIFLDTTAMDGPDAHYASATVTDRLLRHGLRLTANRAVADAVVIVRAGALSTDENNTLVGLPQFAVPFFPVGNLLTIPEVDLYKKLNTQGVAEFAATGFDPRTGKLIVSTDSEFGFAHRTDWVVFLLFHWQRNDVPPPEGQPRAGS